MPDARRPAGPLGAVHAEHPLEQPSHAELACPRCRQRLARILPVAHWQDRRVGQLTGGVAQRSLPAHRRRTPVSGRVASTRRAQARRRVLSSVPPPRLGPCTARHTYDPVAAAIPRSLPQPRRLRSPVADSADRWESRERRGTDGGPTSTRCRGRSGRACPAWRSAGSLDASPRRGRRGAHPP